MTISSDQRKSYVCTRSAVLTNRKKTVYTGKIVLADGQPLTHEQQLLADSGQLRPAEVGQKRSLAPGRY
jgi:hypothetical protein